MDKWFDELEAHMTQLTEEHEQLLGLVRRKREAMRSAHPALVTDCCERENQHVQRIAHIEKRRQDLVGRITDQIAPGVDRPMRLTDLIHHTAQPRRDRLTAMHRKLRQTMRDIQRENDIARRATEGLLRHVRGVIQQVTHALDGGKTYGRRGIEHGPPLIASSFTATG